MLEPLAASVFSSIVSSARPFTAPGSSSHSALRMVARTVPSAFPHDFFTPHPRMLKGKERALPESECSACASGSSDESIYSSSSGIPSTFIGSEHMFLARDFSSCRPPLRRSTCQRLYRDPLRSRLPSSLYAWVRHGDVVQRRHVSSQPEPPPPPIPNAGWPWRDPIVQIIHRNRPFDPEEGWKLYKEFKARDPSPGSFTGPLLHFLSKLITQVVEVGRKQKFYDSWPLFAMRIRGILHEIDERMQKKERNDHDRLLWHSLMARVQALSGSFPVATEHARKVDPSLRSSDGYVQPEMYDDILFVMDYHRGPEPVLRYIIEQWDRIGPFFRDESLRIMTEEARWKAKRLRRTAHDIVSSIEKPIGFLKQYPKFPWSPETAQEAAKFLVSANCEARLPEVARRVLEEMERNHWPVPIMSRLDVVKALAKAERFQEANEMYSSLPKPETGAADRTVRHYHVVGLYLFAQQGLVEYAQEEFKVLKNSGWMTRKNTSLLLHAYAMAGDVERVIELFNQLFPPSKAHKPEVPHFSSVIYAHSRRGDYTGMNTWLEKMIQAGLRPDPYIYNTILKNFASRGDVESMAAIMDQMRTAGMPPTEVAYTTVITHLAERKDPQAAEVFYRRALKEGIRPDKRMIVALMNAHVAGGSWQGVITAFDYLQVVKGGLSIEIYNTLLKAYVLIGAPFSVVNKLFQKLKTSKFQPDKYTFALLIQSACDSKRMDAAEKLFTKMEELSQRWQNDLEINVYVLTIIMAAYLRLNDKVRAKEVYDDMRQRGINPNAVTFTAILKAYANERSEESITVAEQFVGTLLESESQEWVNIKGGRAKALAVVYGPLMTAYRHQWRAEEAESAYRQMLDAGGQKTLGTLSALMDSYRRAHDIDNVRQIWPQIYQLGVQYSQEADPLFEDDMKPNDRRHSNILCIPLSIYINALSAAGQHLEVAEVWRDLQQQGYTFDSHNWNHLVVALIRAGEPERAFEIVEKVILPFRNLAITRQEVEQRETPPTSPLSSNAKQTHQDDADLELPPEVPLFTTSRRVGRSAWYQFNRTLWAPQANRARKRVFVHTLDTLDHITPAWNIWRPHNVVLALLAKVLAQLRSGGVIQPIKYGMDKDFAQMAMDAEELQRRAVLAEKMLARIHENCPAALQAVQVFVDKRHTASTLRSREQRKDPRRLYAYSR